MPQETKSELQVLRVGDAAIVGLPGEFFVEYGLDLKASSPFAVTAIATMTNDHIGYLPTPEAMREGGYETWTARSSWAVPAAGAEVVDQVIYALRSMR